MQYIHADFERNLNLTSKIHRWYRHLPSSLCHHASPFKITPPVDDIYSGWRMQSWNSIKLFLWKRKDIKDLFRHNIFFGTDYVKIICNWIQEKSLHCLQFTEHWRLKPDSSSLLSNHNFHYLHLSFFHLSSKQ